MSNLDPEPNHEASPVAILDATKPAIEFQNVIKIYPQGVRNVTALDGLTLAIPRGEFVSIMGPSGSGKSTFLHLAGGLDLPTSGEVIVDGEVTGELTENQLTLLRRHKIGFVFQFFNLIPTLTIVENASLPALLAGKSREIVMNRAEELFDRVGLRKRLHHYPEELSGGEMQRVAIVRSLINDPPILLADEPTGNLDSATGTEILHLLKDLSKERTIVIVTHDEKAAGWATRHIRLADGKLA